MLDGTPHEKKQLLMLDRQYQIVVGALSDPLDGIANPPNRGHKRDLYLRESFPGALKNPNSTTLIIHEVGKDDVIFLSGFQ